MSIVIPSSAAEASALSRTQGPYLAGGTALYPLGGKIGDAIDISRAVRAEVYHTMKDVHIGAMSTLERIHHSELLPDFLREAASFCASLQLRSAATVGGNIAQRRDDGFLTAAILAINPRLVIMTEEGKTKISAEEYFASCINALILELIFPKNLKGEVKRIGRTSHSHLTVSGARCGDRYAYTASSSGFVSGGRDSWKKLRFKDDLLGSAEYKRYLLSVMF